MQNDRRKVIRDRVRYVLRSPHQGTRYVAPAAESETIKAKSQEAT